MWTIQSAVTRTFDALMKPFEALHPWVGLSVVSVATGVIMLVIFGKTSNQRKIAEAKDRLKAYIMEMWIFRNDARVMLSAIANVAAANVQYLRHSLRPLVFIFVPVVLVMVQLGIRYESQPLGSGRTSIVTLTLAGDALPSRTEIELLPGAGYQVLSPALRMDSTREVEWKVMGQLPGVRKLSFLTPDGIVEKDLAVGPDVRLRKVGGLRAQANTWDAFVFPSEPPLPRGSIVESVRVEYPPRALSFFGVRVHWLIAFFVISVAAGFALKGVFGIEV